MTAVKQVLHVITTINRGGAENHLLSLVNEQINSGLKVTVAYLKGNGYWAKTLARLGITVVPLNLTRYGDLKPLWRLMQLLRSLQPDITHAHLPPAELYSRLALLLAAQHKSILIISKHNDQPFYRGPGQQWMGHWVARRAKKVIAISSAVKKYMQKHLRISNEKLITIPYGIDPTQYTDINPQAVAALRKEWGATEHDWIIGTVARFVPQKSLHTLLQAYAQYRAIAGCSSRLVLVGYGPLDSELKAMSEKLKITDSVVWAGFREDIPVVMAAIDCFSLTSIYEGLGLVLLEAMAAGKPIVATSVSAIPEIVLHELTGLLCGSGDATALCHAFVRLENAELRIQLGAAAVQRVRNEFTIDAMMRKTGDVYHN